MLMASRPIDLSIIVPTFNESKNIAEFLHRLEATLGPAGWEIIFVDDDSPDRTASVVRDIARCDSRVRCLQRIGRCGLSSAVIEGMLASSAPIVAVMDADMQHDETILPQMVAEIEQGGAEVVVATRYDAAGGKGDWGATRKAMSHLATKASHAAVKHRVSDPMSGFFMIDHKILDSIVHNLSGLGFKILLDILGSTERPLRVAEVPYRFGHRFAGESKLDPMAIWEYGMLLADKKFGRIIPVRILSFSIIGSLGVFIHMAVLTLALKGMALNFTAAQSIAIGTAMIFNYTLNNLLSYRDRYQKGLAWFRGLIGFVIACSIGAVANIGIASYMFANHTHWIIAALAGIWVGAVWNIAVTQLYTWSKKAV
ncbi:MAG: glycosyltransferase family 2 protein [Deltaproteobacteria bacterium]|nr:glycosyltransferase family 2 protein [Deltaproteobacteria bacterium]